jgi:Domain of unknown function (DUF3806)
MPDQVEPLNDAERDWVAAHVAPARPALGDNVDLTPAALDELWTQTSDSAPAEQNDRINVVGLALGEYLVGRFDLEWVAYSDEHGTEIAVRGPSDFTVFPTNFVAKRYERDETDFIAPFVAEVERTLGTLRRR